MCFFLVLNFKVKWCLLLCDFVPENDFCSPMRIFFVIFEYLVDAFGGLCEMFVIFDLLRGVLF